MDKNFRTRFVVGVCLFVVALVSMYIFNGVPFKILYAIFSLLALFELFSFSHKKTTIKGVVLVIFEVVCLVCGAIFISKIDISIFWFLALGVPGYDIFAYLFGKLLGGKVFGKARPFPKISKNKTWEGTILGLLMSILMVSILISVRHSFTYEWYFLLCGPFALVGDLIESYLKRQFNIKDSNEIIIKHKYIGKIEVLVGGSSGHGGFLDRIDSSAFTCTALLLLLFITSLF